VILSIAGRVSRASDMSGPRVAATIAASPVLVWVKGKNVTFEKGSETTAYVSGDARIDDSQPRIGPTLAPASAPDRSAAPGAVLTKALGGNWGYPEGQGWGKEIWSAL
jgi:hypothetical protein